MERSLFTKIIDRDLPATIEYEDDSVIAIRDIAPVAPVHILIIPKKPLQSVNSVGPEDHALVGHIIHVAQQLAVKNNIAESGYRVVTNVNDDGGQSVPHLHFHLLGGESLGLMTSHHTSATVPAVPAQLSSAPAQPTITTSFYKTFWRDLAIFLVASIGLAYCYNELNPKHIKWVRPVYTRDTLATAPSAYPDGGVGYNNTGSSITASGSDTAAKRLAERVALDSIKRAIDSVKRANALIKKNPVDTAKVPPSAPCFVAQSGVIKEITYDQFVMFLKKPCVTLIDARIPESFAKGHVPNAININGTEAESPEVIPRLAAFQRDKIIVIYCDGGDCELSHRVADVLKNFGFGPIYIYTGGWAEWSKKK